MYANSYLCGNKDDKPNGQYFSCHFCPASENKVTIDDNFSALCSHVSLSASF